MAPTSSSAASCSVSCRAGSTASGITGCSAAPPAGRTSNAPASCPALRRRLMMHPKNRSIYVRHAPAAADTWSSSKPSSAGDSRAHRRAPPPRPGLPRHDPAWLGHTALRKSYAFGDDVARAGDTAHRFGDHLEPRSWPTSTLQAAREGHVPARRCASRQPVRPPHSGPKPEKPIAHPPWPAASCFGGYRTPSGARYPSQS